MHATNQECIILLPMTFLVVGFLYSPFSSATGVQPQAVVIPAPLWSLLIVDRPGWTSSKCMEEVFLQISFKRVNICYSQEVLIRPEMIFGILQ